MAWARNFAGWGEMAHNKGQAIDANKNIKQGPFPGGLASPFLMLWNLLPDREEC
jgi:hypothetical protein